MRRVFAFVAVVALAFCCGAACRFSSAPQQEPTLSTESMRISIVLPHNDFAYWSTVGRGAVEAGKKIPVDVKISIPQLNYNVSQMTDLIRKSTAARVNAIVVQGIDDKEYLAALEDAKNEGIAIVMVDTDVPEFSNHLYIGTDNYAAGKLMGERLAELTGGSARVAVLSGAEGYPNLEQRLEGLNDAFLASSDIQILRVEYDQYDSLTVMEKYRTILREEPTVDTLICIEGTAATTLNKFLRPGETGLKHIIAFDVEDNTPQGLVSGIYDGLMAQEPFEMGYTVVEELYKYNQAGFYATPVIHTGVTFVTASDLNEEGRYERNGYY